MAGARTGSRAERRPAFVLGPARVAPGTSALVELPIARLPTGSWSTMPVMVLHGRGDGPTVWLSGAIHGDELNGVEIVRRTIRSLHPRRLSGTVLAVPTVNVFGVTPGSRYLPDRRDLNRSFPGSPRGSLASRLAHLFFTEIAARCRVGLDIHTGSGGRDNLPQIRCDLEDSETRRLAEAFAAPVILQAALRDGSLRAAARARGIPVLLYEGGEALRFGEAAIETGVDGVLRVLGTLSMIDETPPAGGTPVRFCTRSVWTRAGRSGFCHLEVEPGSQVEAGRTVAVITDSVGKERVVVRSRTGGIVIGVLRTALVHKGDAIVNVAETP